MRTTKAQATKLYLNIFHRSPPLTYPSHLTSAQIAYISVFCIQISAHKVTKTSTYTETRTLGALYMCLGTSDNGYSAVCLTNLFRRHLVGE